MTAQRSDQNIVNFWGSQPFNRGEDIDYPYYVQEDGRFANFPLPQSSVMMESAGLFDDGTYIPFYKSIVEGNAFYGGAQIHQALGFG